MLQALLLAASMGTYGGTDATIECKFPGRDTAEKPIHVVLQPRPSLKDQPGLYRVIMEMNERVSLRGSARPIASTEDRDILIRAITRKKSLYTIGLRDDGKAALNIQKQRPDGLEPEKSTRKGLCTNVEPHIERWLPS